MTKGCYHLATVKPIVDSPRVATAYTATDLLFNWYAFEIPKGAFAIKSLQMIVAGTEGVAANAKNIELIFAKSVNGAAPPSLGIVNNKLSDGNTLTKAIATAARPHIIGYKFIDASAMKDVGVDLVAYELLGDAGGTEENNNMNMVLEGDPNFVGDSTHSATTHGYQTIWVAAIANEGGEDFGTGVIIDAAEGYAAGVTSLNCDGVAGDLVFAPGDELIAQDGALIGIVKTVSDDGSHTTIVLESGLTAALANDDEVCLRRPYTFHFGIEY